MPLSSPASPSRPTALSGRLSAKEFLGLLHVLSSSGHSGRLSLTSAAARALLVLRRGRLIYAASTSARETLGNILVCEHLIDEETLATALELQHQRRHQIRLGSLLLEMGAVTHDTLRLVVELQARRVMQEILSWDKGYFHFESVQIDEEGEIALELDDFVIDDGLRIDHLLMDLSTDSTLSKIREEAALEAQRHDLLEQVQVGPSMSLRTAMRQISHPLFNAEMTLALLDYAGSMLDRGVLLIRRSNQLLGMAQFGLASEPGSGPVIRKLELSLDAPSAFQETVLRGTTVRGVLPENEVHDEFLASIGVDRSHLRDAVLVPLVVGEEVILVFYGDSSTQPISSVLSLEALMMQASLSIERTRLERKVRELEDKLAEQRRSEPDVEPPSVFRAAVSNMAPPTEPDPAPEALPDPEEPQTRNLDADSSIRIDDLLHGRKVGSDRG